MGWWVLDISLRTSLSPNIGLLAGYKITKGVGELNLLDLPRAGPGTWPGRYESLLSEKAPGLPAPMLKG